MPKKRRKFNSEFKAKIALEAIRGDKTVNEIATEYEVHPNQVSKWKVQLLERLPEIFSTDKGKKDKSIDRERDELYRQIGKLKVEIDWLKKKTDPFFRK